MDAINHPSHYVDGREIEPISVIEDWNLGFHLGNALKYLSRAGRKDEEAEAKDLRKAIWYMQREIDRIEGKPEPPSEEYLLDPVVKDELAKIDSAYHAPIGAKLRVKDHHGNVPSGLVPGQTYTVVGYGDFGRDGEFRLFQLAEINGDWAHTRFEVVA